MSDLTKYQLAVLRATDWRFRTRDDIAIRVPSFNGGVVAGSLEGLNQTLGSLVRRGLLERTTFGGRVHFQITDKGAAYPGYRR